MGIIQRKRNARTRANRLADLPKRTIVSQARVAGKRAALRAMRVMGFVITIEDGWVIKRFKDGQIEKISKIAH
ncbi:MAG: hypothetical protein KF862_21325 [Chitinophagaceae bacterium]|nr:hypothetical protein [Chitinophagaceae bacterium]